MFYFIINVYIHEIKLIILNLMVIYIRYKIATKFFIKKEKIKNIQI